MIIKIKDCKRSQLLKVILNNEISKIEVYTYKLYNFLAVKQEKNYSKKYMLYII